MNFNFIKAGGFTRFIGNAGLALKKASPTILVGIGVIGSIASIVKACADTPKAVDILEEHKKYSTAMKEAKALNDPRYDEKAYRKDVFNRYIKTGFGLLKVYAPTIIMEIASISCFLVSHHQMSKRNVALASAYALLDQNFNDYKARIKEVLGVDTEKAIRLGEADKGEESTEEKVVERKETEEKKPGHIAYSPYSRFFCEGCTGWTKDPEVNYRIIINLQSRMNDRLKRKGHIFLNEIYESLGIPITKAGYQIGWYYDPKNPKMHNVIDFGLSDPKDERIRAFVNGYERNVLLDFNVDGNILNVMPEEL